MNLSILSIQIDPGKIGFLKFILEGYDGLGILTTRDSKTGKVDILYPRELQQDIYELIDDLTPSILKQPK